MGRDLGGLAPHSEGSRVPTASSSGRGSSRSGRYSDGHPDRSRQSGNGSRCSSRASSRMSSRPESPADSLVGTSAENRLHEDRAGLVAGAAALAVVSAGELNSKLSLMQSATSALLSSPIE